MLILLFLLLFACFNVTMTDYLYNNPTYYQLDAYTWESDDFRALRLGKEIADLSALDYDLLTGLMVENDYDLTEVSELTCNTARLEAVKPAEFKKLKQAYELILKDLKFFPIPDNSDEASPIVTFENGWQDKRTYGGDRGHEGCDIMGTGKPRGYYPVISMSDGTVEKIGWLEQGGYRIGIRTPGGAYLYYAHLYGYSRDFAEGEEVKAGQLLGFMGDTGYSTIEGTTGNFDVHLHLGIYIKTDHSEEMSVNPYWVLQYLQKFKLKYTY